MNDDQILCSSCEREIDDSLTWCPYCGAEATPAASASPSAAMAASLEDEPLDDGPTATGPETDPFAPTTRASLPGDAVATQTAPGSGGTKSLLIGLAVLLVIGGAAAVFFLRSNANRGDLSVTSVSVGDCWNDPESLGGDSEIADIPEVPCDEPHANEVFAVVAVDGGDGAAYPGEIAVQVEGFGKCLPVFASYIGVPFSDSPLDVYTLFPTASSWLAGDRDVICSVYMPDGSDMVGTKRNSSDRLPVPAMDFGGLSDCTAVADNAIGVAQEFIDFFDGSTQEELDAAFASTPPEMVALTKSESLLIAHAGSLGCDFEDLNTLVINRAGALEWTSDFGGFVADEISTSGFFPTE